MAVTEVQITEALRQIQRSSLSDTIGWKDQLDMRMRLERDFLVTKITSLDEKMNLLDRALNVRIAQQEYATTLALTAAEKSLQAALAASRDAIVKAEAAAEKRFDSVNEFRSTLKDQQALFPTRAEMDTHFSAVEAKISVANSHFDSRLAEVRLLQSKNTGKMEGASLLWAALVGVFGLVLTALAVAIQFRH